MRKWWIVAHNADFTSFDFSCRITRNWWLVTRISLSVISAVRLRVIGWIVAHDAVSTPCDFSRPIARFHLDRLIVRFNPDRPIVRFNPDRLIVRFNPDRPIAQFNLVHLISLFTPRRHRVGIHVGLRGPAMCLHRATSPPGVRHD